MSSPYVGEIRMFGGNFAPVGWAFCNGQLLPISENATLFQLIGATYGGDGQTTFALPDLRGRIPVHVGTNFALAQAAGSETVTLTASQLPQHSHVPLATSGGTATASPGGNTWGTAAGSSNPYTNMGPTAQMNASCIGNAGGSQPHDNMMPFLCISFIISLFGIFPSQT